MNKSLTHCSTEWTGDISGGAGAASLLIYQNPEQKDRTRTADTRNGRGMAARTIRSWRGAWILGIGLLGVAGTAGAQQNAERRPEATRAELEALWAKISPEQRSYAEAVALRERLDQGDFQVGDKVVLHVQGDTSLSREFTVNATRGLDLPNIGEVPLLGVLHSELTDHLRTVMARYIKSVDLRAESLIRIAASGQLTRPGFYNVSAASVLGDVFT